MNKNTETFLKVLPVAAWGFFTVIAAANSMNTLTGMGIVAGIASLLGAGYVIYKLFKKLMKE